MMDIDWLRRWTRHAADWAADYRAGVRERPVRAQTRPGSIYEALPVLAPEQPEPGPTPPAASFVSSCRQGASRGACSQTDDPRFWSMAFGKRKGSPARADARSALLLTCEKQGPLV